MRTHALRHMYMCLLGNVNTNWNDMELPPFQPHMHTHIYNNNNDNSNNNNKHILIKTTYLNKECGVPNFLPQPVCSSRVRISSDLGHKAALTSKCRQKAAGGACAEVREEAASLCQELFKATWLHRILTGHHNNMPKPYQKAMWP